ncbi:MAG: VWA domain-containing protein, partial [Desulfobacula sp.]|nr:VWA domain-containing protein [Desulfobacula sp.]
MFRFASPLFLCLLLVVALSLFLKFRKKTGHPIKVSSLAGVDVVATSFMVKLATGLPLLKTGALILLILALARPQWGDKKINVTTEGVNIILALDLSESMRALDFSLDLKIVTRLEAVKTVVQEFIMKREGDRIGMVVFGSNAFTQLPLTRDYNTIAFILDRLMIGAAGPKTAIGDAIGISLKRLEDIQSKSNIIILLTDGKSNSGELSWQDATQIA